MFYYHYRKSDPYTPHGYQRNLLISVSTHFVPFLSTPSCLPELILTSRLSLTSIKLLMSMKQSISARKPKITMTRMIRRKRIKGKPKPGFKSKIFFPLIIFKYSFVLTTIYFTGAPEERHKCRSSRMSSILKIGSWNLDASLSISGPPPST